jgi:hypothetical protein
MSVAAVQKYLEVRSTNNVDDLMALLSDDIHLNDADGKDHNGKEAVRKYYEGNKCGATDWQTPVEKADDSNYVTLDGKVKGVFLLDILLFVLSHTLAYMMWWKVRCEFQLKDGLLSYISIKKV